MRGNKAGNIAADSCDRTLVWISLIALAGRVVFVLAFGGREVGSHFAPMNIDGVDYDKIAVALLEGQGFSIDGRPTAYRPPLYPWFLAGMYSVFGRDLLLVRLAQSVASALSVWMVGRLALRLTGNVQTARLAACFAALYPFFIFQTAEILTESLFSTLVLGALVLVLSPVGGFMRAACAGGLLGAAMLTKPALVALLPPFVLLFVFARRRIAAEPAPYRQIMAALVVASLLYATPVLLWSARNTRTLGHPTGVTTSGGFNLVHGLSRRHCIGELDRALALIDEAPPPAGGGEVAADRAWSALGRSLILAHPGQYLAMTAVKFVKLFAPVLSSFYSLPVRLVSLLSYGPMLLGFLVWPLLRRDATSGIRLAWWLVLALTIAHGLVYALFFSNARYRIPVADPLFMIYAADVVVMLWVRHRSPTAAAPPT